MHILCLISHVMKNDQSKIHIINVMNVYKSIYNRYKLLLLFFCGLECCQTFLGNGRLNIMNGILKVCKCKDIV